MILLLGLLISTAAAFRMPSLWGHGMLDGISDAKCMDIYGNRDLYDDVLKICDDCQNVFRDKSVGAKCKQDCFASPYFETCIYGLELAEKLTDYKMQASLLRAGRK